MPPEPRWRWRAFHRVKGGNAPEEYEDAWAAGGRRFAVADGASESSFAAPWARLLAEGFVAAPRPWRNTDWLAPLRQRWAAAVDPLSLPWYAEAKREQGAFATLLGLAVRPGHWRALAVGDSCLFRVRRGRPLRPFPLGRSADFNNRPDLLGSTPGAGRLRRAWGRWRPGDTFFLMTDALAEWWLRASEAGGRPWEEVAALPDGPDAAGVFAAWVEKLRAGGLRNDDVTLVRIDT